MKKRGAFIVLEGIDRTGKTTQSALLASALESAGFQCVQRRFPDRSTATGRVINDYLQNTAELRDQVIHLLYSANRWEAIDDIRQHLEAGTSVICDRYAYSGVAFSAAKGLDVAWCKKCDDGLLAPDCVIYLDMPVEESKQRGDFGGERYEREDFQRKVQLVYEELKDDSWVAVNAGRSVEQVHADMLRISNECLSRVEREPAIKQLHW